MPKMSVIQWKIHPYIELQIFTGSQWLFFSLLFFVKSLGVEFTFLKLQIWLLVTSKWAGFNFILLPLPCASIRLDCYSTVFLLGADLIEILEKVCTKAGDRWPEWTMLGTRCFWATFCWGYYLQLYHAQLIFASICNEFL